MNWNVGQRKLKVEKQRIAKQREYFGKMKIQGILEANSKSTGEKRSSGSTIKVRLNRPLTFVKGSFVQANG